MICQYWCRFWLGTDGHLQLRRLHDDVIKSKHFPRYWPFVQGIHRSQVNSPHKGQSRGALMYSLICVWMNGWVNNPVAGNLRLYRAHYDVIVMYTTNRVISVLGNEVKFKIYLAKFSWTKIGELLCSILEAKINDPCLVACKEIAVAMGLISLAARV